MTRDRGPDFLLIGAPKAGTSALHKALVQHPGLFMSAVKEPKYYLCGDSPPRRTRVRGTRTATRSGLAAGALPRAVRRRPATALRGRARRSTPLPPRRRRRIAADRPDAKLIAVLRDPVDRAYSNWMHLWTDGLEPRADIVEAVRRERWRIDEGWAPFWHYSSLGMYGRQVADLYDHVPAEQVLLLRNRDLIDAPARRCRECSRSSGAPTCRWRRSPPTTTRPYVKDGPRTRVLGRSSGRGRGRASSRRPRPGAR